MSGGGASRVFQVAQGVTATLSGLTITNNAGYYGSGGGVLNQGMLSLTDCTISANSAEYGGGLDNDGTATLTDCNISGNLASDLAPASTIAERRT